MNDLVNKGTLGCSVLAAMFSANAWSQKLPEKPNMLIIMTDQQSSESMSFNLGHKYLNTPNMDWLAEHGVSFTNAYCANPLCIPSRSSIFTGRYPHEMGIQDNAGKNIDPVEFPSLGIIFKNAGYETGYVGKWHLPYREKDTIAHGFNSMANIKPVGVDSLLPGAAIKFLETKHEKPFLLVVSFCNPHNICEWARGSKLPDGPVGTPPPGLQCPPLRPNHMPSKDETDIMQLMRKSYQASKVFPVSGFSDEKWRQYEWAYYRMIEKVDRQIGAILTNVNESALDENTIIVFMADHGDCQGAHLWNQKTVFYEEAAKVPLIISYKGLKGGKADQLVQTGIDLIPTLCEFAGIRPPKVTRGVSLKQIVEKGSSSFKRDYVVVSDKFDQGEVINGQIPKPEGRMLRNVHYKYWIYDEGNLRETLYDLQNDPGEMVNIAGDPKYKTELNNCRKQLMDWAIKNSDAFRNFMVPVNQ
jgi:arylsulfatase A-like enzyme